MQEIHDVDLNKNIPLLLSTGLGRRVMVGAQPNKTKNVHKLIIAITFPG